MRRAFAMLGHLQFNWLWALCTECVFSSIQFTHESKYMHGCRYALNGTEATMDGSQCLDLMYGQALGWSYVIPPANGLASSVDDRLWSAGMFKNKYWFRVVSVPGMHETSGIWHRSRQDPNRMATAVKWRHTAPTASEDDQKANTTEYEKTSPGLTTTEYSRRTWQRSIWLNGKIVACRAFEQDLSPTSNNDDFVRSASTGWHIITELQRLCSRARILSRFIRLVLSEFRSLRYFTDAWGCTSTRLL